MDLTKMRKCGIVICRLRRIDWERYAAETSGSGRRVVNVSLDRALSPDNTFVKLHDKERGKV